MSNPSDKKKIDPKTEWVRKELIRIASEIPRNDPIPTVLEWLRFLVVFSLGFGTCAIAMHIRDWLMQ